MGIVQELIRNMGLWKPQKEGLLILDEILAKAPIGKGVTKQQTLATIIAEPRVQYAVQQGQFNFNEAINPRIGTSFPSFCFAIATGGGKTLLMGASIAYLYYSIL